MALVLLLAQQPLQPMNDALLEQIRQASTRHGPQTVRRLTRDSALNVGQVRDPLLVPVIMEWHTIESGDFRLRLARVVPGLPRLRPRYQPVAERCADGRRRPDRL